MATAINEVMLAISSSLATSIVAKVTITTALGLAAAWVARGNRAAIRHALLAATFGVILLLPVVSLMAPQVHIIVPVEVERRVAVPPLVEAVATSRSEAAVVAAGYRVIPAVPQRSWPSLPVLLFAGWTIGAVLFLLPVVIGRRQIRSLLRSGLPWRHGQSVAELIALDAGIRRRVDVLLHEAVSGPMTCGIVHPAIVLPQDAESWNEEDLNRAIVHELEHVRRGDSMSRSLARLACAAYWFHPLVWTAWRALVLEAERSCDDAVLRCSEATAYADQLVGLAKRLSTARRSPLLAMANRADLTTRVTAVLDSRQRRGRAGTIPIVLAFGTAIVFSVALSTLMLVVAPQSASGQTAQRLEFEATSVKPHKPGDQQLAPPNVLPGGRFTSRGMPLIMVIGLAYDVPYQSPRLTGGPSWIRSLDGTYDIEAVAPKGAVPDNSSDITRDRVRRMLQAMLADRFKLAIHRETKELAAYALVVAKNGPKLQKADIDEKDCGIPSAPNTSANVLPFLRPPGGNQGIIGEQQACHAISGGRGRGLRGRAVNMADLVRKVEAWTDHPLLDKTGLKGLYKIETGPWLPMEFGVSPPPPGTKQDGVDVADLPTLFTIFDQLGLKMESQKETTDVYIIDHVDKPTGN
jgi:bla regulator protein BlaR1